jgi:hypothetical protein
MKRFRHFGLAASAAVFLVLAAGGCAKKQNSLDAPPARVELGLTVVITPTGIPAAEQFAAKLSKGARPNEDHLRWKNESGQQVTIQFKSGWPFFGTDHPIVIESGAVTEWFTLGPNAVAGAKYDYGLTPDLIGNSGGPTDPSVSSEP